MWQYQLQMAWQSILRFRWLSALICLAIALGLAATTSTLTMVARMGDDPIPSRSQQLYSVRIDAWGENAGEKYRDDGEPPDQLTYMDAVNLMDKGPAEIETAMYKTSLSLKPDRTEMLPELKLGRVAKRHFFEMFDLPFAEGGAWSELDDRDATQVVVIASELKEKYFGDQSPLGKTLELNNQLYRIVGVLKPIERMISAHDVTNGPLQNPEQLYLPFSTAIRLQLENRGNNNCWSSSAPGFEGKMKSECIWLQYWAMLPDENSKATYQRFLNAYALEQDKLGRFARLDNNRLYSLTENLEKAEVVSRDQKMAAWVGVGLLLVALVNAACLLLAKFLRGARESAVHRALGASKGLVFRQHLLEGLLIALLSSALSIFIAALVLFGLRRFDPSLADVAQLDFRMLMILAASAIGGTMLASLLPAWRVSRLPPAASLRSS